MLPVPSLSIAQAFPAPVHFHKAERFQYSRALIAMCLASVPQQTTHKPLDLPNLKVMHVASIVVQIVY